MSVIRFDHVSKAYDLHAGSLTLASSVKLITGSAKSRNLFYALSDVSFQIRRGESFGIIGRNGAGKSTILKLIAGITRPTSGTVEVKGLISSLIELGAGFHPDLTGRENIYMSGAILGLPRKYIESKFEEIVDFSELWSFIDVPVKKYSSGMYARLGFSVAVSVKPEILIIDEILSVGDVFFQQKCFTKMREIIGEGTTFIYVTHDMSAMQNLCQRTLLLDRGRVEFEGATTEAVSRYYSKAELKSKGETGKPGAGGNLTPGGAYQVSLELSKAFRAQITENDIVPLARGCQGDKGMEIIGATFQNDVGEYNYSVKVMGTATVRVLVRANRDIEHPNVGFSLFDRMNTLVFSVGMLQRGIRLAPLRTGDEKVVSFKIQMSVSPGEYTFVLGCGESEPDRLEEGYTHHRLFGLGPILVTNYSGKVTPFFGVANLQTDISVRG